MHTVALRYFAILSFGVVFLPLSPVSAQNTLGPQANGTVLIDGISVITGSHTSNESEATPILLSDIEFEATLILASTLGPGAILDSTSPQDWRRAKRQAVLLRMLAAQARYLHETASETDTHSILKALTRMVGGESAMSTLLTRLGLGFQELTLFSETAALALTQLQYFEEQVSLSSWHKGRHRRNRQRRDRERRAAVDKNFVSGYRHLVGPKQTEAQIEKWITDLMDNGHIRTIR